MFFQIREREMYYEREQKRQQVNWARMQHIAKLQKQLEAAQRNQHRNPMLRLQVKALKQQIAQLEESY